mgnify:CR=1 FL=1
MTDHQQTKSNAILLITLLLSALLSLTARGKQIAARTAARAMSDTRGEINIVAMVLIIIVVIALVAIFRSEMTDIVTKMFEKIRSGMEL